MTSSMKRKLRLTGAFVALATLALAISCRGFFVNPTLTGLSVGPQGLDLNVNQTFQLVATGTYDDGSQKTLTSGIVWSSDTPADVTVGQTSGIVTGIQTGSATITGSSGGCSACTGTTTVTVVLTGITQIVVTPSSQPVTIGGTAVAFNAVADPSGTNIDTGATWTVQDSGGTDQTSNFQLTYVPGTGEEFLPNGATAGSYKIVVTYPSTNVVGTATLIVNN
jgi:hypothetical protein